MKESYTSAEARAALRVDAKTFLRWLAQADMQPHISRADHRVKVFSREQVEHLANEHERILDASEVTLSTDERIAHLADRVSVLEHLVTQLTTNPPIRRLTAPRATYEHRTASEKSATLPGDLVAASIFGEQHGIAHSTTHKAIDSGRLAAIPGQWKIGRALVKHALDASGRAAFYALYHDNPHFTPCQECPHEG